jgi:hypothetical protein
MLSSQHSDMICESLSLCSNHLVRPRESHEYPEQNRSVVSVSVRVRGGRFGSSSFVVSFGVCVTKDLYI